ncbi:GGDEF domain-containing protein [Methylophaga lonarensis]|uniref:GGDEF domain-containing protein n=1 Tax=Methylophaga lonarensis TaxID=999151 RepID=UPI003D279545
MLESHEPTGQSDAESQPVDYRSWYFNRRIPQIRYVLALTILLYCLFAAIDLFYADGDIRTQAVLLHGVVLPVVLLVMLGMTLNKKVHRAFRPLLMFFPVLAVSVNLYLYLDPELFILYKTELYFIIIWTFALSGLLLKDALFSGLISILLILAASLLQDLAPISQTLHYLAISTAFTFGLITAYLTERLGEQIYIQHSTLKRAATTDNLTSLWNRYKIESLLDTELARAERYQTALSVIMIDIDHFKRVNDEHGHLTGDQLLRDFAALLLESFRSVDHIGRFGGEEFLIVMPSTDLNSAYLAANNCMKSINAASLIPSVAVTASFGVTAYHHGETKYRLLQRVDETLYTSKRNGRNQITIGE